MMGVDAPAMTGIVADLVERGLVTREVHPTDARCKVVTITAAGRGVLDDVRTGPDIAPYHHRQIIPLPRDQWAAWLDPRVPAEDILKWLPEGSLEVTQVYGKPPAQGALAL